MQPDSEISAFDRGVRPVMNLALPQKAKEIVEFRADRQLQERIEELARKSTEGALSDAEKAEYAGYARANKFIAILQRQARAILRSSAAQPDAERGSDYSKSIQTTKSSFSMRPRLEAIIDEMLEGHVLLDAALEEFEKLYIQKALTLHEKGISQAAEALGIHRKTLAKRVASYRSEETGGAHETRDQRKRA